MSVKLRPKHAAPNVDEWWLKIAHEFARLHRIYPTFHAERRKLADGTPDTWVLLGPPVAKHEFRKLAALAAQKVGYSGTPDILLQSWLSHINGDDIQKRAPVRRRTDYTDTSVQIVTKADGTKEGYRGRQRIG